MSSPTLTGNVHDITGANFGSVDVMIEPINAAPFFEGQSMVAYGIIHVRTDGSGNLPGSVFVSPGDYQFTVNGNPKNSVRIRVPDDTSAHNYFDLIISAISAPGIPVGGTAPVATSTVSGTVKTNTTSGTPVVYLKSEVDTLLGSLSANGLIVKANRAGLKAVNSSLIAASSAAIMGPASTDGILAIWNAADTTADNGGNIIQPADNPASGRWHIFF